MAIEKIIWKKIRTYKIISNYKSYKHRVNIEIYLLLKVLYNKILNQNINIAILFHWVLS